MASTILPDSNKSPAQEEEEERTAMLAKLDMVSVLDGKEIFDAVTQAFPTTLGKAVSKKEREETQSRDPNLVYGEITFEAFGTVFEKIKKVYGKPNVGSSGPSGFMQSPGGIFYDLGSGTGKPVIAAAILHKFDICYGIELLEGLYSVSLDMLNTFNTKGKARLATRSQDTRKFDKIFIMLRVLCFRINSRNTSLDVQMIQGDFLKMRTKDWRDADILFLNSTCYDESMMTKIAQFAGRLSLFELCLLNNL